MLAEQRDIDELIAGVKLAREIYRQPAMRHFVVRELARATTS